MKARKRDVVPADPCIYCGSTKPRTKREHVMSQAFGKFEQNWTLTCVCDECNMFFSKELELALARDSREALLRIELGLKPPVGVAQFLNRRMKASLQDPGQFDGARMVMMPTKDGSDMIPVPVAQVGFKRPGEDWRFLTEPELTPEAIRQVYGDSLEMRIHAPSGDAERLKGRLAELGIPFGETYRLSRSAHHRRITYHRCPSLQRGPDNYPCCCEDRLQLRGKGAWRRHCAPPGVRCRA